MDNTSTAARNIEGFVEAIVDDTIYGWVNVDPVNFSLSAVLGESIIGAANEFVPRGDLNSKTLAKGFSIKCARSVTPADLIDGKLRVVAISNQNITSLPVWGPLREAGTFLNISLTDLKKAWNSIPSDAKDNFARQFGGVQGGREFGRVSRDGVVQAGRNGFLFLLSGSNHLSKFYSGELELNVDAWVACFLHRQKTLEELKVRYIQVMIPEKSSIYFEYAPFNASAGSTPYLELIKLSLEKNIPICDVLPNLLAAKDDRVVYLQGDTHLSTFGSEVAVKAILQSLDEKVSYDPPNIVKILRVGDLGERYVSDGDIQELVSMYQSLHFDNVDSDIELISSFDPETGHQGRRRAWRNATAPIKKKVVCFGGSSFERGENSGNLSWWFARLFSEFHFIWSPNLDLSYVESVSPDIVICQSIERFLTEVPDN